MKRDKDMTIRMLFDKNIKISQLIQNRLQQNITLYLISTLFKYITTKQK